jgi:hypothetical protein
MVTVLEKSIAVEKLLKFYTQLAIISTIQVIVMYCVFWTKIIFVLKLNLKGILYENYKNSWSW